MTLIRLAFRNVVAAGMRTWINTFVLALTILSILLLQGLFDGMYQQMAQSRIEDELGNGQFWHQNYDPFDPLSLEDSHAALPPPLKPLVENQDAAPILIVSAAIYPKGRVRSVLLKGIMKNQNILKLPTSQMNSQSDASTIPIMIGRRMARQTGLLLGDTVTARWRTHQGAFDALDLEVVHIFDSNVPAVDQGQIWLPLEQLREMVQVADHATVVVMKQKAGLAIIESFWRYQSLETLLADTQQLVDSKSAGGSIFYLLLLFLAMIAVFDTQALAIFKRRKEIGTLMALGMTPRKVLGLFTLEGMFQGALAFGVTLLLGGPLLWYLSVHGIPLPVSGEEYGLALSDTIYPVFSVSLITGTFFLIMVLLAGVSYWPARHIARLLPSDALRVR